MNHAERIQTLLALSEELTLGRLHALMEAGQLDEHYQALTAGAAWIGRLMELQPENTALATARQALAGQGERILEFYRRYFFTHPILGEAAAAEAPDVIFFLACKSLSILRQRVDGAAEIIRRHPRALVVLCGGGFDPALTEAAVMRGLLQERGLAERDLVMEDDSIDTVANGVFAKLKLRVEGKLPQRGHLLVVTSAFHAARSLNIFRRVFGPPYTIAALPVCTTPGDAEATRLSAHELRTEERSSREIFGLAHPLTGLIEEVTPGDEVTLFHQLLLHHDFYRHRYDLLRKYRPVLDREAASTVEQNESARARWTLELVPMGADLKGKVPPHAVALDVGSGEPPDGIFDHHLRPGAYASAAELVYAERRCLRERLQGDFSKTLLLHRDPDLDCFASAAIAWTAVEKGDAALDVGFPALVDLCNRADQGREQPGPEPTLYTLSLMLASWRHTAEGHQLLAEHRPALAAMATARGLAYPSHDGPTSLVTLGLLLILAAHDTQPKRMGGPLDSTRLDPVLRAITESITTLLQAQLHACAHELERARHNGWIGHISLPGRRGQAAQARYVRVVNAKTNAGLLAKYLRSAFPDATAHPILTILQDSVSNRTVVSVDPDGPLSLKGLAYHLEQLENARGAAATPAQATQARFRYQDAHGREQVDPLFPSPDPWYDGRAHAYTIVDTPGCGTALTLEEIFHATLSPEWPAHAPRYETPAYRAWIAGQDRTGA